MGEYNLRYDSNKSFLPPPPCNPNHPFKYDILQGSILYTITRWKRWYIGIVTNVSDHFNVARSENITIIAIFILICNIVSRIPIHWTSEYLNTGTVTFICMSNYYFISWWKLINDSLDCPIRRLIVNSSRCVQPLSPNFQHSSTRSIFVAVFGN